MNARRMMRLLAGTICLVCTMASAILVAQGFIRERSYDRLRTVLDPAANQNGAIALEDGSGGAHDSVDATRTGWLAVEGTSISYPVVRPAQDQPRDWFLDHDAWGNWDALGCPYLDTRATWESEHLMIFGHHALGSRLMFSDLAHAYEHDTFAGLGDMRLVPPDAAEEIFSPLCALHVDASYGAIQRFSFDGENDFRAWLRALCDDADTLSPLSENLVDSAKRAVTLVTCSSEHIGQRERTLVVFVRS